MVHKLVLGLEVVVEVVDHKLVLGVVVEVVDHKLEMVMEVEGDRKLVMGRGLWVSGQISGRDRRQVWGRRLCSVPHTHVGQYSRTP